MSDPNAPAPRGLLNWWQGLILAISSAIIGVMGASAVLSGQKLPGTGSASWAMMLLRFVPHFLLLFGVLADAFTYEGVYWTGTMVGVLSTLLAPYLDTAVGSIIRVFVPDKADTGPVAATASAAAAGEYEGCRLSGPGVSGAVPQTLTVTASILMYYIFDLCINLSVVDAAGAIVAALVLFGGQAAAIADGCAKDKIGQAAMFAGLYGLVIGGSSFATISAWAPGYLPSSVLSGSASSNGNPGGPGRKGLGMSGADNSPAALAAAGGQARASTCPQPAHT